jgi:ATP-dependent helicase HrpB
LDHLRHLDLTQILGSQLSWEQRRRLDEGAPTHLTLPNGRRRALEYRPGEPPVLAARLQELFGLVVTPRVCWERVPVMVHILSPAGRPVQVTQDLTSFWDRTYQEVRRELRGRYPKHAWPEDPRTAAPVGPGQRRS